MLNLTRATLNSHLKQGSTSCLLLRITHSVPQTTQVLLHCRRHRRIDPRANPRLTRLQICKNGATTMVRGKQTGSATSQQLDQFSLGVNSLTFNCACEISQRPDFQYLVRQTAVWIQIGRSELLAPRRTKRMRWRIIHTTKASIHRDCSPRSAAPPLWGRVFSGRSESAVARI